MKTLTIFLLFSSLLFSQVTPKEEWLKHYNTSAPGSLDIAVDLKTDASGNVFVAGQVLNSSMQTDILLLKYSPAGTLLWQKYYDGGKGDDDINALAVDNEGNVYFTGETEIGNDMTDMLTVKYDPSGNLVWAVKYSGSSVGNDAGNAITVNSSGDVFVSGMSMSSLFSTDFITVRYDKSGTLKWASRYTGTNMSIGQAMDIALDNLGNIYAAGSFGSAFHGGLDYLTVKYNSEGAQLWASRYNGPANSDDIANSIAVDQNGNVFVTGLSNGSNTSTDILTLKYDNTGKEVWNNSYNGTLNREDQGRKILLTPQGDLAVIGTVNSSSAVSSRDLVTILYNSQGSQQWAVVYNGPANDFDEATGAAVDNAGNIYVCGQSTGNNTGGDYLLLKYNMNGQKVWEVRYNSGNDASDQATAISVLNDGTIYLTGNSGSTKDNSTITTIKYSQQSQQNPTAVILSSPQNNSAGLPLSPVLKWFKMKDASAYELQLATSSAFNDLVFWNSSLTDTFKAINNLTALTKYYWRVRALVNNTWGEWSDTWAFETQATSLQVPALLWPLNNSLNQPLILTFQWDKVTTADKYQLQIAKDMDFINLVLDDPDVYYTSRQAGPLQLNTQYYWRVRAKNSTMTSNWSAVNRFTTTSTGYLWIVNLNISDNGSNKAALTFGLAKGATNGVDKQLDEMLLPPLPPKGIFDARFELPITPNEYSLKDFRSDTLKNADWLFTFQPGTSGYPIVLKWNPKTLPPGIFHLRDVLTGFKVFVNMKYDSVLVLTNTDITALRIEFRKEFCTEISYDGGWTMISLPFKFMNMLPDVIFPGLISPIYEYLNGYNIVDVVKLSKGYWAKFNIKFHLTLCGEIADTDSIVLKAGWNLIGPVNGDMDLTLVYTVPADIISSMFFGFNNGYFIEKVLKAGKGYWVKSKTDGTLHIRQQGIPLARTESAIPIPGEQLGEVVITDNHSRQVSLFLSNRNIDLNGYDMPPMPPAGIFDARFSSDRFVEILNGQSLEIRLTSASYPVRIRSKELYARIKTAPGQPGTVLTPDDEFVITDPNITSIYIEAEQSPSTYQLFQNYPNPFNPATNIKFYIPEKNTVSLVIYDHLGQKVAELLNGEVEQGFHIIPWNAGGYASGVYFYELRTPVYSQVKKLILLK